MRSVVASVCMMNPLWWAAFADELVKLAVKVPVIHGTSGAWKKLTPGVGPSILSGDPNPRAVYVAMKNVDKLPGISQFAEEAARARNGVPTIAHTKIDTQKGWGPRSLTEWGRKHIGSRDDAHALIEELDGGVAEPRRGEIWEMLQRGTGAWVNEDPAVEVAVRRSLSAPSPADAVAARRRRLL